MDQSYNISEYIDSHLKPIANRYESFVKNTEDLFIKIIKRNFEIIPIEQTPILGFKTETDLLRLEREAFWIRTLETKKPFGINVESGKSVERDKIIFPIIYNRRNVDIGKIMKDEYLAYICKLL